MGAAPTLTGFEWTAIVVLVGGLWGLLAWLLRRWMEGVEDNLKAEAAARNAGFDSLRATLNRVDVDFRNFELMVAKEYTARAHLSEALAPLTERIEGFRHDIKELFTLVHTKQDRRGAD